jgi:hypothetical protein
LPLQPIHRRHQIAELRLKRVERTLPSVEQGSQPCAHPVALVRFVEDTLEVDVRTRGLLRARIGRGRRYEQDNDQRAASGAAANGDGSIHHPVN